MDVVINLLIWVHIIAFIAGGSNSVAGPVIAGRLAGASAEVKAGYYGVKDTLSRVGRVAMVTLLITGPLIIWLKYGGFAGISHWFWVKMLLVVVLIVAIVLGDINEKKGRAGDAPAAGLADTMHKISGLSFALLILAAVLAFN